MKPVIIIAIAFVLLIPTTVFAQEGSRNMMEEYCLKNLQDDPQCANYTPKKIEQNKIEQNKTTNPIDDIIQFILQIFQGFNPEESMKDVTKVIPFDSIEKSIESVSDSVHVKLESLSEKSENSLEDCSAYKENRFSDKELLKLSPNAAGNAIDDMFVAQAKMKACEQRNNQIEIQQALQDTSKLENVSLQTTPNKIKLSKAEGQFTPSNLIFIEHPKFNEIKFTVTVSLDIAYDKVTRVDQSNLFLIDENSKKYHILVGLCGPVLDWINGRNTDTVSFMGCYDVGKDVNKLDIMYKSYGPSSTNVKIGTIQIKN